jgi:hypothetical protein
MKTTEQVIADIEYDLPPGSHYADDVDPEDIRRLIEAYREVSLPGRTVTAVTPVEGVDVTGEPAWNLWTRP